MNRPCCKHLRSKSMYIEATPEAALKPPAPGQFAPCHYWCNLTQTAIGPDDQPVHKDACHAARACCEE